MGWGRYFFLGDFGQQLDLEDHREAIHRMRRSMIGQFGRDQEQDEQIAALQTEVANLKMYIGSMCQILINKGVMTEEEIERIADAIYGPPEPPPAPPTGETVATEEPTSPELSELANAVRQKRP